MIDKVYKHSLLQKKNENPYITSRNRGRDPNPCLVCKIDHCRQQLREFANLLEKYSQIQKRTAADLIRQEGCPRPSCRALCVQGMKERFLKASRGAQCPELALNLLNDAYMKDLQARYASVDQSATDRS